MTDEFASAGLERLTQTGSWQWEPSRRRMTWSEALYRILELDPDEVSPSREALLVPVHPDDRALVEEVVGGRGDVWAERLGVATQYRVVLAKGVRHMRLVATATEGSPGQGRRVVGVIQDVTDQRWADREIAAYAAAADALASWDSLESGGARLLEGLAVAMDFESGVLWLPRENRLWACAVWGDPLVAAAARATPLPRGAGLAGRAWEQSRPVNTIDLNKKTAHSLRGALDRASMRGGMALPAGFEGQVLAVLGFHSREEAELTEQLMGVLIGIGELVGHFLALHRGQLAVDLLTGRELEVLRLAADGMSVGGMSAALGISGATIKTHLEHIHRKLGVTSRAAAVAKAMRAGLIE